MEINIKNALKRFYPNPSLEMVYFEAIANSIDAGATKIDLKINIESYANAQTLIFKIKDDGLGFTKENFAKFSKLMETKDEAHKGLGRLVFLNYFSKVKVTSFFENKGRSFLFDLSFKGQSKTITNESNNKGTTILFEKYNKKQVKTYDYLKPDSIKKALLLHFFPLFYSYKIEKKQLVISISLKTEVPNPSVKFETSTEVIDVSKLPQLKSVSFRSDSISLIDEFTLFYEIKEDYQDTSVITAICAEGRTIPLDVFSKENVPQGHELSFLLYSKFFDGKVNSSRQKLDIKESELESIKQVLILKINQILDKEIPAIKERNKKLADSLNDRFPHLHGYFTRNSLGLLNRSKTIESAQKKFFIEQKKLLESTKFDDEQYMKSLEVSSRILTEYILYREKIIKKLKETNTGDLESDLHEMIIPMRKTFRQDQFINDIYSNNIWLLDDKFMTYTTILSDEELGKLILEISTEEEEEVKDSSRPDIAIVFSKNPNGSDKGDVVIVELKKKGVKLAKKEEVVSQLKQRARKLLKYYPNKIQRMWFYGIVDFNTEFRISLKEDNFAQLYSEDQLYYKEQSIIIDERNNIRTPIGLFILSYDAMLLDAESRNSTFLNILKDSIAKNVESNGNHKDSLFKTVESTQIDWKGSLNCVKIKK